MSWLPAKLNFLPRMWQLLGIAAGWESSAPELRIAMLQKFRAEFQVVPPVDSSDQYRRAKEVLGPDGPSAPNWPTLYDANACLLRLLPMPSLVARFDDLKDEYADVAGKTRSVAYFARLTPAAPDCDEQVLRSQAIEMLSEINRLRITRFGFTRMRNRLVAAVTCIVLVMIVVLMLVSGIAGQKLAGFPAIALGTLAIVGMLGGSISSVSRVFGLSWSAELAGSIDDLTGTYRGLLLNVFASVLQGAVFALTVYVIFASGMVQGSLFPKFRDSNDPVVVGQTLGFFERGPVSHPEFAKALVWAFVAGFSERLVPDFLNSLQLSAKASAT